MRLKRTFREALAEQLRKEGEAIVGEPVPQKFKDLLEKMK